MVGALTTALVAGVLADNAGNTTSVKLPQQVADGGPAVVNQFTEDNLIAATHTPLSGSAFRSTRYIYSPAGLKTLTETARCASGTVADCVAGNSAWTSAGTMKVEYGANGRVHKQIGRDDSAITTTYAQDGQPVSVTDPGAVFPVTAGYYLDGLPRTVDDGQNVNSYAYTAAADVSVRTDTTAGGGVTGGDTTSTSYAYNAAGLVTAMKSGVSGAVTVYGYDDGGRTVAEVTGAHITGYSWNPDDTLAGTQTTAGGSTTQQFVYGYNGNRDMVSQTATGSAGSYSNTFTYNANRNLTGWNSATYTWDKNDNRLTAGSTQWTYRADNSIASVDPPDSGQRAFVYDDAGRLTSDGCTQTDYDAFDRTQSATTSSAAECAGDGNARTVTYTYDGLDRPRTATVSGAAETGANITTSSVYDGLSPALIGQTKATTGNNSAPSVLYQLDADGQAMAMKQTVANALTSYLDSDGHGSTTSQVSTNGTVQCAAAYDPFGGPTGVTPGAANGVCRSGPAADTTGNARWYRGAARDASTGTYQFGTRTYDPATAAFTTPDTFRIADPNTDLSVGVDPLTANTYTYVNGNPLNLVDPSGHWGCWSWKDCKKAATKTWNEFEGWADDVTDGRYSDAKDTVVKTVKSGAEVVAKASTKAGGWARKHGRDIAATAGGIAAGAAVVAGAAALGVCTAATGGLCALGVLAVSGAVGGIASYGLAGGEKSANGYLRAAGFGAAGGVIFGPAAGRAASKVGGMIERSGAGQAIRKVTDALGARRMALGEQGAIRFGNPAAKSADDFVDLASTQRRTHILNGDATGGGHLWPGAPGKTPFPQSWSGDRIMHELSDIATDPALQWRQITGVPGSALTKKGTPVRYEVIGNRGGIDIRVILEPGGEGIITGHPW